MKPLDFPVFLGSYDYATLYNEAQKTFTLREYVTVLLIQLIQHYHKSTQPLILSTIAQVMIPLVMPM
jgi:hypothetical protein